MKKIRIIILLMLILAINWLSASLIDKHGMLFIVALYINSRAWVLLSILRKYSASDARVTGRAFRTRIIQVLLFVSFFKEVQKTIEGAPRFTDHFKKSQKNLKENGKEKKQRAKSILPN